MSEETMTVLDHHDDNKCDETAMCGDCLSYAAADNA